MTYMGSLHGCMQANYDETNQAVTSLETSPLVNNSMEINRLVQASRRRGDLLLF